MNQTQRKLFLIFCVVLAGSVGSVTAVVSYLSYQGQLARFGDIFDRIGFQQTQAWVMPVLIGIFGITLMVIFVIVGLWKFYGGNAENRVEDNRTK